MFRCSGWWNFATTFVYFTRAGSYGCWLVSGYFFERARTLRVALADAMLSAVAAADPSRFWFDDDDDDENRGQIGLNSSVGGGFDLSHCCRSDPR